MSEIPESFLREHGCLYPKLGYTMNSLGNYSSYASPEEIKKQQEEAKKEIMIQEKWKNLTKEDKKSK